MLWVKEVSTNVIIKLGSKLYGHQFVQRNRKRLAIGLLIWFAAIGIGTVMYRAAAGNLRGNLFEQGTSMAGTLATTSSALLLEKDILDMNKRVGEVGSAAGVTFAAIVDHEGHITAHTDPSLLNQKRIPLQAREYVNTIDQVVIEEGRLPDQGRLFIFVSDITFAGTAIGKSLVALSAESFYSSVGKYRIILFVGICLGAFLLASVLAIWDRLATMRARAKQKQFEGVTKIGPYVLRDKIALGGMAEVFLADYLREDGFKKKVAVKRVLAHLAQSKNFIKMFIREARLAALLQHPNIVQIVDFGNIDDSYFIAMEYVRGKTLSEFMHALKRGMDIDQAVYIISQICMGLEYSHNKKDDTTGEPLNIVHRDVSPQNILISMEGEVKLNDFGISKANTEPSLTQAGVIRGKFSYLAPEQALGETVDHQADIYALGVVFYEVLSGRQLYKFDNALEAMKTIPEKDILPIKNLRTDIPDPLNSAVMKCLERDKSLRYQRLRDALDDLAQIRKDFNLAYDRTDLSKTMKRLFSDTGSF